MKEYWFDAKITVEAESLSEAIDLVLDHNMEANIAVSLHRPDDYPFYTELSTGDRGHD